MNLTLTSEAIAAFDDKDSKRPEFLELYQERRFIDAYAAHTDLRMREDPHWAIGRGDEWATHGDLQLAFLKANGVRPEHTVMDLGCGPGRAARRIVPYLEPHRYVGVDISGECIAHAIRLAVEEGWDERLPRFYMDTSGAVDLAHWCDLQFDFVWAHSVFTHLPPQQISLIV